LLKALKGREKKDSFQPIFSFMLLAIKYFLHNCSMLETNFSPFPEIQTQRLLLRRMVLTDAPEVMALRSNEAAMQYVDRPRTKTIEEAEAWIKMVDESLNNNNGIAWAITLAAKPNELIGNISFWRIIKEHYRAEVGYMLSPAHWRTGVMKEALLAVHDFGFKQMQLHSIEAHINPANKASAAILESVGYTREAYFKEDYFFKGTFRDTAIYSLLVDR
jgi:ribosomal-protein-alanine N-acetyltransferase